MDLKTLQKELDTRDNGVLMQGAHTPGGREFCALEFESQVRGRKWSDTPITLPDLRSINDWDWDSDKIRTKHLLPVMVALWDWSKWSKERKVRWATYVALETIKRIMMKSGQLTTFERKELLGAFPSVRKLAEISNPKYYLRGMLEAARQNPTYVTAHAADLAYNVTYDSKRTSDRFHITLCKICIEGVKASRER